MFSVIDVCLVLLIVSGAGRLFLFNKMLLYLVCKEDILNDDFRSKCNIFLYFAYAGIREINLKTIYCF